MLFLSYPFNWMADWLYKLLYWSRTDIKLQHSVCRRKKVTKWFQIMPYPQLTLNSNILQHIRNHMVIYNYIWVDVRQTHQIWFSVAVMYYIHPLLKLGLGPRLVAHVAMPMAAEIIYLYIISGYDLLLPCHTLSINVLLIKGSGT